MEIKTRWGLNHVAFCGDEILVKVPTLLEVKRSMMYKNLEAMETLQKKKKYYVLH
jgi:hypothetical protein